MLILSRRIGEQIQIGEDVCVTVVRIGQGGVRIGVDAPDGCSIARSEIEVREDGATGDAPVERICNPS